MKDFEKIEVWEDYWCFTPKFEVDFSTLRKLNYYSWFNQPIEQIEIRIEDFRKKEQPSDIQIKTLEFILSNQKIILENIFNYYLKVILPVYKTATDIEENEIALNENDLNLIFGLKVIEIPQFENNEKFYFLLEFDFKYDNEHGIYILFDKTAPIDFFGNGDKNYETITLFEKGIKSSNGGPLKFNLYQLNGESVFQKVVYFDEVIEFDLQKGTYRAFIGVFDRSDYCRNFYVPNDLTIFTMKKLLTT